MFHSVIVGLSVSVDMTTTRVQGTLSGGWGHLPGEGGRYIWGWARVKTHMSTFSAGTFIYVILAMAGIWPVSQDGLCKISSFQESLMWGTEPGWKWNPRRIWAACAWWGEHTAVGRAWKSLWRQKFLRCILASEDGSRKFLTKLILSFSKHSD